MVMKCVASSRSILELTFFVCGNDSERDVTGPKNGELMWDWNRWKQFIYKEVFFWIVFLWITKLINDGMIQGLGGAIQDFFHFEAFPKPFQCL